jgi:CRISPR/Cas system-associated exonuclease Cas4 (RecB family)
MITKSLVQSYLQCPRRIWLEANDQSDVAPEKDAQAMRRASDGDNVGEKAREALGTDLIWPSALDDKVEACRVAMAQLSAHPEKPGVEVPLAAGDFYARADALIPAFAGHYVLQETKASSFPLKEDKITPSKPEAHHLDDIAIQAWVMLEAGVQMERAELNLLNSQWRYPGDNDYSGLFRQLDVTEQVISILPKVNEWVSATRDTIALKEMPVATTGKQCQKPHSCPFEDRCKAMEPPAVENSIFLLPDIGGKTLAKKLADKGMVSLTEIPEDELVSSDPFRTALYRRMRRAHRTKSPELDLNARDVIDALPYPRFYFDFEGIDLAIPVWKGVRPFEQIPFQWSCHIQRAADQPFEHAEFLDLTGNDPSLPCIEAMHAIFGEGQGGPILVYFATYEKGRLQELANRHPVHKPMLDAWIKRLVDLLPIVKNHYYHPVMAGSFSIKKVLKAMAPELDYSELEGVQDGVGAQLAYIEVALNSDTTVERKQFIEKALRVYCGRDTWAMVVVAHHLARKVNLLAKMPLI